MKDNLTLREWIAKAKNLSANHVAHMRACPHCTLTIPCDEHLEERGNIMQELKGDILE